MTSAGICYADHEQNMDKTTTRFPELYKIQTASASAFSLQSRTATGMEASEGNESLLWSPERLLVAFY